MRLIPPVLFVALTGCPYIGEKEFVEQIQDWDGDGAISTRFGGEDCRDEDPSILDCDSDDDGELSVRVGGEDCDDEDAGVFPGAPEVCDGRDQDCDGRVDEVEDIESAPAWVPDDDGDDWGSDTAPQVLACEAPDGFVTVDRARDCDDLDDEINPNASEFCDEVDSNCDGDPTAGAVDRVEWVLDSDGDGVAALGAPAVERACEAPLGAAPDPTSAEVADCDDTRADVFPGAPETWYDGVDADCAGDDDFDADRDGSPQVVDCDDANAHVFPGAVETCNLVDDDCDTRIDDADDGIDDDANRSVRYLDLDLDGYGDGATSASFCLTAITADYVADDGDCDDDDDAIHPFADERCDNLDNDCDGGVDEGAVDAGPRYRDADGDGFGSEPILACSGEPNVVSNDDDCDDADSDRWPGAPEVCGDDLRQDCSTRSPFDCDGDGYDAIGDGGTDCDDGRASVNPDAREICDGLDNDCDTRLDDQDPNVDLSTIADWFLDADADGFGDPGQLTQAQACAPRPGEAPNDDDCDDTKADANPDSREACDGYDNDCDLLVDDDDDDRPVSTPTYWLDLDGDTFGNPTAPSSTTCEPLGPEWVDNDLDCQPGLAAINPFALETCDGLDNDCDGFTDDTDPDAALDQWFLDDDGDGYGQSSDAVAACGQPEGRVAEDGDCDDFDAGRNPGASEVCDGGIDNDCDALSDDADPDLAGLVRWWPDDDNDGYGDSGATPVEQCGDLPGYVNNGLDCDDLSATRSPAAPELCNALDDDCDALIDDEDGSLANAPIWYEDADIDGWGSDTSTLRSCDPPVGYRPSSGDCDDADDDVYPNAPEVCNAGVDDDCDGLADAFDSDAVLDLWYTDGDGDGAGGAVGGAGCGAPTVGLTALGGDCDDTSAARSPTATEVCDGLDNDCDGDADDADTSLTGAPTVYRDADGDGYGVAAGSLSRCVSPAGYAAASGDECHPVDPGRHPGAVEVCDGNDDDCDGTIDDNPVNGLLTYADGDDDGYGAGAAIVECAVSGGRSDEDGDCDDASATNAPGAPELCDGGIDNDCDGDVDDADSDVVALTWYRDQDADGFGSTPLGVACDQPSSSSSQAGDCDDADGDTRPNAFELCDGADNDCDGQDDFTDPDTMVGPTDWAYADADGDGFYSNSGVNACAAGVPGLRSTPGNDCDDADALRNLTAVEVCDAIDNDCDFQIDDADPSLVGNTPGYRDLDDDGFGDPTELAVFCTVPATGWSTTSSDCDDTDDAVNIGAIEVCSGVDDDCDGLVDDADLVLGGTLEWLADADRDGWGGGSSFFRCEPLPGQVPGFAGGDCDDADGNFHPGAPELCDGFDNDCDGPDDDLDTNSPKIGASVFTDADGDGFGVGIPSFCAPGANRSSQAGDCDDNAVDGQYFYPGQSLTVPSLTGAALTSLGDALDRVCDDADITVLTVLNEPQLGSNGKTVVVHGPSQAVPGRITGLADPAFLVNQEGLTLRDVVIEAPGQLVSVAGVGLELTRVTLRGGSAINGAGLAASNAEVIGDAVVFEDNVALGSGGGADVSNGVFVCHNCVFDGNLAPSGAAIRSLGSLVWMAEGTFAHNVATTGYSVELLNTPATTPSLFEDASFFEDDGLRTSGSAQLRRLRMVDSGNLYLQSSGGHTLLLADSDIVRGGGMSTATVVVDGAGSVAIENNRFLQSGGGDMSVTSTNHDIVNNTFVDAVDTMIHIVSGTPTVLHNVFRSSGGPTVVGAGTGEVRFNLFNTQSLPPGVAANNLSAIEPYFQTYNPNLNAEMWDVHLPPGAPQIDAGDPGGPFDLDSSLADLGAFGGVWSDPWYADADADGMGDGWELYWFGTLVYSGSEDLDADYVDNFWEYVYGTRPYDSDTDDDGCWDDEWLRLDPTSCGE